MTPDDFVERLGRLRALAILRTRDESAAGPALAAAIRGGFGIVEVTLNTPGALDRIAELAGRTDVVVGAGTVLGVEEARAAVARGARFLVSPVTDLAVVRAAKELGVAMIPGTATPSEMLAAARAGAPLQKLFPAPSNGPEFVRACLGPMPFLRIVPTSGVDASNAARFLEAGAFAVGFVSSLFAPEDVLGGHFDRIEHRARTLLDVVRSAHRPA